MPEQDIYEPNFVCKLFDEMSATYGVTNYVSSFGFCERWRRECIEWARIESGMLVYDLMTGMGECWHLINEKLSGRGGLLALDISEEMCKRAAKQTDRLKSLEIELVQADFLTNSLPANSADCVVSCFGLKTFSPEQMQKAALEISRILKHGGRFSLFEISVPPGPMLRFPYMSYLKYCIPITGRLLLGNPDNYRLLALYTEKFRNCSVMKTHLENYGLTAGLKSSFYGCATGVCGYKS